MLGILAAYMLYRLNLDARKELLLCRCSGDENVVSLAEIGV